MMHQYRTESVPSWKGAGAARTGSTGIVGEELAGIRRELAKLQQEIQAGNSGSDSGMDDGADYRSEEGGRYGNAPAERLGSGSDSSVRNGAGNMGQLQVALERSVARLERERQQRKVLEQQLAELRRDRLRETSQVIDGLERKREDLNRITKERNELREWLDRAVRECRRVADEVVRLRQELEASEQRREKIEVEVQQSRLQVQNLTTELEVSNKKLTSAMERQSLLEARAGEHGSSVERAEDDRRRRQSDCENLAQQVGELEERVRGQQQAESHLQLLTECMRQLQRHIEQLGDAIRADKVEELLTGKGMALNNSDAISVDPDKPVEVVVENAKELLRTLVSAVRHLQSDIVRFLAEYHKRMESNRAAREAEVMMVHLEKQSQQHQYSIEKEELQKQLDKLNAEIKDLIGEATERQISEQQQLREESHKAEELESLLQTNEELASSNTQLRAENELVRQKLRRLRVDWAKVHESQQRLQQLQLQVSMMAESFAAVQRENDNLKIFISTVGVRSGPSIEAVGGPQTSSSAHRDETAGLDTNVMLAGNGSQWPRKGVSGGSHASSGAPSQQRAHPIVGEREAFQDWKRAIISEYV